MLLPAFGIKAQEVSPHERHPIGERRAGAAPRRAALQRRVHRFGSAGQQLRLAVFKIGARVLAVVAVEAPRTAALSPAARQRHLGGQHRHAAALPRFLQVQRRFRQPQKLSFHTVLPFFSHSNV